MQGAALFLISMLFSFGLGFPIHRLLLRWNVIDRPNSRSSHQDVTARGGGLAIMAGVFAGFAWLLSQRPGPMLSGLFSAVLVLAIVSWFDDIRSVRPLARFLCQALVAVTALYALDWPAVSIGLSAGSTVSLPAGIGLGMAFLWLTGYTNAFNFMDGINGLAAGQAAVTGFGSAVLAGLASGRWTEPAVVFAAVVAGAAAGFLPHNFPRARMFMGDVSSAPLGFLLAFLALWLARDCGWWLLLPLSLLHANFVLDTGLTLGRRILRGERWYEAHREHFYQRLIQAGKSHSFVTGWELALQTIVLLLMLLYLYSRPAARVVLVGAVLLLWGTFFVYCERSFRRECSGNRRELLAASVRPLAG